MRHALFPKIKNLSKRKGPFVFGFLGIVLMGAALISVTLFNTGITHHASELNFTTISKNKKVTGSVMPASCESYPTFGTAHYAGDSGGHCPATCPAGSYAGAIAMQACSYWVNSGSGDSMTTDTYYYVIPSSSGCPGSHPTYGGNYSGSLGWGSATMCQENCWNGSVVYPSLGQSCPVRPTPAVDVNFQ